MSLPVPQPNTIPEETARVGNDCRSCPLHERCMRSAPPQRQIAVRPQAQHEALRERRAHERSADFAAEYARRAGIEGTLSEAVRAHGMRRTR